MTMFEMLPALPDRLPMPPWMNLAEGCILGSALIPPPGWGRVLIFVPLVVGLNVLQLCFNTGTPLNDYVMGTSISAQLLAVVDRLVLSHPERDFYKLVPPSRPDDAAAKPGGMRQHWTEKIWWCSKLFLTNRGVGWSWQVKNTPPSLPVDYSRWSFVIEQLVDCIQCYLITDVVQACIHASIGDYKPGSNGLFSKPLAAQFFIAWSWAYLTYNFMNMSYKCLAAGATAVGLTRPRDWPPMFGVFGDSYTLRRFWSRSWHQMMRRLVVSYGTFAARDIFHFPKGSLSSRYTQLYVGFAVTTLVHLHGGLCTARREMGETVFFMGQAVAITAEDAVIAAAKKAGIQESAWTRAVGYLWVFAWFSWSMRAYVGQSAGAGIMNLDVVKPLGLGRIVADTLFN